MSTFEDAPQSTFSPPADDRMTQRGRPSRADRLALGQSNGPAAKRDWSMYTVSELVRWRDEITDTLPPTELSALSLEEEMLLQYHTLRELQNNVLSDDDVPANQRAQVANAVASTLKTLGDMQITLYSSERFKDIENLLVRTLSRLPEEAAAEFLTEYEQVLRKHEQKSG